MPILAVILIRLVINAVAFGVTAWLFSGVELSGGVLGALWVSLLFGIVNAIVGTFVRILTLPLTVITLGLFAILVNAFLLWLTDAITSHLTIDDFWWTTVWASLVLAVVSVVLELALRAFLARGADETRPAVA